MNYYYERAGDPSEAALKVLAYTILYYCATVLLNCTLLLYDSLLTTFY